VATYGAESRTLNKGIAKRLVSSERNVLRRVFGGIKVNGNWRKQRINAVCRFRYTLISQNELVE
jgi:hypothetical protein